MFKLITLFAALMVFLSACAGSAPSARGNSASPEEAEAAARAAVAAMDGGGAAPVSSAPSSQSSRPSQPVSGAGTSSLNTARDPETPRAKPAWVDSPDAVYGSARYISAVGYGSERSLAERDALAKLTGVFGQSVQSELTTIAKYSEVVKNGAIQVSEDSSVDNAIITSAEMDSLVGAEIADVWFDNQKTYYAAAVMERERTSVLYADLIHSNERIIAGLVDIPPAQRNSLDAYSRYILAATIADANRAYANVLTVVGDTRGINPAEMKRGDDYRLDAAAVARNIPIGVSVTGDRGDRILGAFSKALSGAGFRSGGNNTRYALRVSYTVNEVVLANNPNKWVRYQLNSSLVDSAEGDSVLFSFNAGSREGHLTITEAEERAMRAAEGKITGEFGAALNNYLSSLLSGQR